MSELTPARRNALADARANDDGTQRWDTTTKLEHPVKIATTTPSLPYRRFNAHHVEQIDCLPRYMSRRGRHQSLRAATSGVEKQMMTTTDGDLEPISLHWIITLSNDDYLYATN
ncbi:uncharacterized protein TrAFT101_002766 [Trichoderma asperellum]|uniref:uncharacterized protein n=1 Tax=Trichoderma asperellum TaxID=101201 RepID=UPI00332E1A25|nr:hypothetical protein TrAFT101_002766 [Trichoderma asperellum]